MKEKQVLLFDMYGVILKESKGILYPIPLAILKNRNMKG